MRVQLKIWREQAEKIPSPDLRTQALASFDSKTFHCAGGGMYGLLAEERIEEAIRFIVAYQTICDYLDNLCEQNASFDPEDFRLLHLSMRHALTPGAQLENYYALRKEQDDHGYLANLVKVCQDFLSSLPGYEAIKPHLLELMDYYCFIQIHNHIAPEKRRLTLEKWFEKHEDYLPAMTWYEFVACCGSTMGIYALVSSACRKDCDDALALSIKEAHFPWVHGLNFLLDYLIDQGEDKNGEDLNFYSFYPSDSTAKERMSYFYRQANISVSALPHARFHKYMNQGLIALYGSDPKVNSQKKVLKAVRQLLKEGGITAWVFYYGCRLYRRMSSGELF